MYLSVVVTCIFGMIFMALYNKPWILRWILISVISLGYLWINGWRLLLLTVSYRTNILLLPPYPSKHVRWNFNQKTAGKAQEGTRTTYYTAVWHLLTPHKIHPDITPQSRKITDWGEYLGRADASAGAPGPQVFWEMINENIHYNSHKYTGEKRNRENLKITLKRDIIVVRTSRV